MIPIETESSFELSSGTADAAISGAATTQVQISAVIPCLNEQETIGLCIEKALKSFDTLGVRGEVVVADNGSTDQSVAVAQLSGAKVVHERRKGYGAALLRGIRESNGEIIVMADADDSYDWLDIGRLIDKIREGYDLVMGNRFQGGIQRGAMPPLHRYLGNPVLSLVARVAFRTRIGDFHCGMRAFTRTAFEQMQLQTTGMEFATEMIANAVHQRLKIAEVPVVLYPDKRNRPPHLRSFRDGWRHLRFILTYAPDYMFVVPGMAMFLTGVGLDACLVRGPIVIHGLYFGIHFLALGALLTLAGFNILNLGVLAKTLMTQRYGRLKSRTVAFLRRRFSLEAGLLSGVALMLLGGSVDAWLMERWLTHYGAPMNSTIHLAFVVTTGMILGLNLIFTSFLLNLILADHSNENR